jgi:acyl-CoA hydrolase
MARPSDEASKKIVPPTATQLAGVFRTHAPYAPHMVELMDTFIEDRNRIQPHHANNLGTAHGGNVLYWMDEVGAMSAMRFAGQPCVTAHIDSVDFQLPLELGDIALVEAYVYDAGQTSVRVRVRAHAEAPMTGHREVTTESYFVFVAIDEDRQPVTVPELTASSEEGRRLREQALSDEG